MMETLPITTNGSLMPVMSIQDAVDRRKAIIRLTKSIMTKETDYGVIPGTSGKATLFKAGAEKLCSFFGLAPRFELIEKQLDWTGENTSTGEPFFYFQYKCQLWRNGEIVGEGIGSCNSWERKYRYRQAQRVCPNCQKEAIIKGKSEYGGGWICFNRKGGCGAKWADGAQEIEGQEVGLVPNDSPADLVNTIDKMAQKRALIASVLITVNASEFFTQDMSDDDDTPIDVSFRDVPDMSQPEPEPQPEPPKEPASKGQMGMLYGQLKRLGVRDGDKEKLIVAMYGEADQAMATYDINLLKASEALPPKYITKYARMLAKDHNVTGERIKTFMQTAFKHTDPGKLLAEEQDAFISWLRGEEGIDDIPVIEPEIVDDDGKYVAKYADLDWQGVLNRITIKSPEDIVFSDVQDWMLATFENGEKTAVADLDDGVKTVLDRMGDDEIVKEIQRYKGQLAHVEAD